ncbi:MAG: oligosaccharide flippase family protein, partial [Muribaculaceae bacterium]|nr:oligosaccharide flippase family protein [Muribaculaceae bacterium]
MSENKDIKSMAVHGVAWTMAEKYSAQIVQFARQVILDRLLSADEYVMIGVLAIVIAISTVFIDGGFSAALIQYKDRNDRDVSTVFYLNVGLATVIYIILFFCAPLIAGLYEAPILTSIVRVYCLT